MRKILLIVLLFAVQPATAGTDVLGVNTDNNALGWTTAAAIVTDWGTTLDVENHSDIYEENRWLGKRPSRRNIHVYFLAKLGGHWLINTSDRTKNYKNIWNIGQLYMTVDAVDNSYRLGLRVNF